MEQLFPKVKLRISSASARRFVNSDHPLDERATAWVEFWIENYLRNNCLPLQFIANDWDAKIMSFLPPMNAEFVLQQLRTAYQQRTPQQMKEKEDMTFLDNAIAQDSKSRINIEYDGNKPRN